MISNQYQRPLENQPSDITMTYFRGPPPKISLISWRPANSRGTYPNTSTLYWAQSSDCWQTAEGGSEEKRAGELLQEKRFLRLQPLELQKHTCTSTTKGHRSQQQYLLDQCAGQRNGKKMASRAAKIKQGCAMPNALSWNF